MLFKELLDYFEIEEEFPQYLYEQSFNKVFLEGELSETLGNYKIVITTRQNVTHQMFLNPHDEYPVVILSELPNGLLNGMKFGLNQGDITYINGL